MQDPLEILLDSLSVVGIDEVVAEKFLVTPKIILLDADQKQELFEITLIIERLDRKATNNFITTICCKRNCIKKIY